MDHSLDITADERNSLKTARNNHLWMLVIRSLNLFEESEVEGAIAENILGEARTFNAGRASSIRDFKRMLLNLQQENEGWD